MRLLVWLLVPLLIVGCSLSPAIDASVSDYFQVSDLATNRSILLNILRAKDGAPLHFSELSQVRGQMTAGGTATVSFPFGPEMHASSPRELAALSGTVSSSPSFDVVSLDTQDFTKGVMAPIAPATLKFFLDEGIDSRLVLLLLVGSVSTPGNQETILNEPESARAICYPRDPDPLSSPNFMPEAYVIAGLGSPCPGHNEPEFIGFLRVLDQLPRVYAKNYHLPPQPYGGPFSLDMHADLRALAEMDPTKYRLTQIKTGKSKGLYQLVVAKPREIVLLCGQPRQGGRPSVLAALAGETQDTERPNVPENACYATATEGDDADVEGSEARRRPLKYTFTLRSTLAVIQYIGRILAFQEIESRPAQHERCVTLDYEGSRYPGCNGNILFHLQHDAATSPIGLSYNGQYWSVPTPKPCEVQPTTDPNAPPLECDHTMESMAMVALLLNQNKSSKDIPKTPAVEAVP